MVLVIAVLLRMVMRRKFSIILWEALALLLIFISALGLPVSTGAYIYTLIFETRRLEFLYVSGLAVRKPTSDGFQGLGSLPGVDNLASVASLASAFLRQPQN